MKIIALMGSQRKNGSGYRYMTQIKNKIISTSGIDFEYLFLSDFDIKMCKGCMVCYEKGEDACPLKDDYLYVIGKLLEADAVIFYSPTYTLSISGMLKNFFDRSSYICHRPLFKGKYAVIMTAVGAFGEKMTLRTLSWIVSAIGFRIIGKIGIRNGGYDRKPDYALKIDKRLQYEALKLVNLIKQNQPIEPSLFELISYNYQKEIFSRDTEGCRYDKQYWINLGWTAPPTDYFYDVKISQIKTAIAKLLTKILIKTGFIAT
ncbi:Multimeric flavodoxin WrbA [Geosporobacter subterraneus DSM 17957]|uniref:Multimeric flavodoxin WrbA n=1 Tax=Geosporobacter subterraneus DSM 17957 TaxID=1121919 RepID=A0A1M6I0U4_9FIRM|nr:flavodoxin family protein [Geosporobacter subterraneus]SHJ28010.1 Multimeric flavodoxin WrbA [Geosporobacter subterraneus DSM 17957]